MAKELTQPPITAVVDNDDITCTFYKAYAAAATPGLHAAITIKTSGDDMHVDLHVASVLTAAERTGLMNALVKLRDKGMDDLGFVDAT